MIGRKEYRYLSPSFLFHPKTQPIVRLKGAGLVHNPNLFLKALASQDPAMPAAKDAPTFLQSLADIMGLDEGAADADIVAALVKALRGEGALPDLVAALKDQDAARPDPKAPDPKAYVPAAAVQAMQRDHNAELAARNEARVKDKVETALSKGYFHGGLRDWALSLCRSDEAAFDAFIAQTLPPFGYLLKETHTRNTPPLHRQGVESDTAAASLARSLACRRERSIPDPGFRRGVSHPRREGVRRDLEGGQAGRTRAHLACLRQGVGRAPLH